MTVLRNTLLYYYHPSWQDYIISKLKKQQLTERDISITFQRVSITPETRKQGNEREELTTPFKTKIYTAIGIFCKENKKRPDTKFIFEYPKKNVKHQTFCKIS